MKYCIHRNQYCAYCGNMIINVGFTIGDSFSDERYIFCDSMCADKFEEEYL